MVPNHCWPGPRVAARILVADGRMMPFWFAKRQIPFSIHCPLWPGLFSPRHFVPILRFEELEESGKEKQNKKKWKETNVCSFPVH